MCSSLPQLCRDTFTLQACACHVRHAQACFVNVTLTGAAGCRKGAACQLGSRHFTKHASQSCFCGSGLQLHAHALQCSGLCLPHQARTCLGTAARPRAARAGCCRWTAQPSSGRCITGVSSIAQACTHSSAHARMRSSSMQLCKDTFRIHASACHAEHAKACTRQAGLQHLQWAAERCGSASEQPAARSSTPAS